MLQAAAKRLPAILIVSQLDCCRTDSGKVLSLKMREVQLTCSCAPKPCLGPTRRTMLSATRTEMSPAFCATQPDVLAVLFAMLLPASSRFCSAQGKLTQESVRRCDIRLPGHCPPVTFWQHSRNEQY